MEEARALFIRNLLNNLRNYLPSRENNLVEIHLHHTYKGDSIHIERWCFGKEMPFYWYGLPQDLDERIWRGETANELAYKIVMAYRKWWGGLV